VLNKDGEGGREKLEEKHLKAVLVVVVVVIIIIFFLLQLQFQIALFNSLLLLQSCLTFNVLLF